MAAADFLERGQHRADQLDGAHLRFVRATRRAAQGVPPEPTPIASTSRGFGVDQRPDRAEELVDRQEGHAALAEALDEEGPVGAVVGRLLVAEDRRRRSGPRPRRRRWPGVSACRRVQKRGVARQHHEQQRRRRRPAPASTGALRHARPATARTATSSSESAASSFSVPAVPSRWKVTSPVPIDPAALPAMLASCTQPTRAPTLRQVLLHRALHEGEGHADQEGGRATTSTVSAIADQQRRRRAARFWSTDSQLGRAARCGSAHQSASSSTAPARSRRTG